LVGLAGTADFFAGIFFAVVWAFDAEVFLVVISSSSY
jgi:hypothetical protein